MSLGTMRETSLETMQKMFEKTMRTLSPVFSEVPDVLGMEEYMRSMKETWISLIYSHLSNEEVETLCRAFILLNTIEEDKIVNFNEEFMVIAMNKAEDFL